MQATGSGGGGPAPEGRAAGPGAAATDPALVDDLAAFVKYLIHAYGTDFFRAVGELDLSFSQVRALGVLVRDVEEATLKDLGDRLGLSLPAVSRSVEGLVKRGLVTRAEDAADRRFKQVRATPEGRALLDRLVELRVAGIDDFLRTVAPRDRRRLAAALEPIVAREEIAAMRPPARRRRKRGKAA
ncbi:MAG TPA: MarR family transcriptional regulator [Thermoleophilaceae bacterium]